MLPRCHARCWRRHPSCRMEPLGKSIGLTGYIDWGACKKRMYGCRVQLCLVTSHSCLQTLNTSNIALHN